MDFSFAIFISKTNRYSFSFFLIFVINWIIVNNCPVWHKVRSGGSRESLSTNTKCLWRKLISEHYEHNFSRALLRKTWAEFFEFFPVFFLKLYIPRTIDTWLILWHTKWYIMGYFYHPFLCENTLLNFLNYNQVCIH